MRRPSGPPDALSIAEFEPDGPPGSSSRPRTSVAPGAEPLRHTSQGFHGERQQLVTPKAQGGLDASRTMNASPGSWISGAASEASLALSTTPSRKTRPGTGRFYSEELSCFRRVPTPSPMCSQKSEVYWQNTGGMRRVLSEGGLHTLPAGKGKFYCSDELSLPESCRAVVEPVIRERVEERPGLLPLEETTAMVLDLIYPRSAQAMEEKPSPQRTPARKGRQATGLAGSDMGSSQKRPTEASALSPGPGALSPEAKKEEQLNKTKHAAARLLTFRTKILDKFSTVKAAFDSFTADRVSASQGLTTELSRKEFSRFLTKHFGSSTREENDKMFDFLDFDHNGHISLAEFHTAVEASAPVRRMEDLRRKWIALGFTSMRQAIAQMIDPKDTGKRLTFSEFGAALSRVGIVYEDEHQNIFNEICDPNNTSCTVSIDELTSAISAVSPSLLLEDIKDRITKKYGGNINAAYNALDQDQNGTLTSVEFMRGATSQWRMTTHESQKAFRQVDIDKSRLINRVELLSALRLSEPSLLLEEIRRKVRQRFRSIHEVFSGNDEEMAPIADREVPSQQLSLGRSRGSSPPPPGGTPNSSFTGDGAGGAGPGSDGKKGDFYRRMGGKGDFHRKRASNIFEKTDSPDDVLSAFRKAETDEAMLKLKTPDELHNQLQKVQLSEQDTLVLFDLVDIDRDGKMSPDEFVRGVRLFAPSCMLEDLRLRCLRNHSRVADVFASIPQEKREVILDLNQFEQVLKDLDLTTGVNIEAVVDLVEPHKDGGLTIGELIAALQAAAPGSTVPLPPHLRDARAKAEVRGHMAAFHKSCSELRALVRQSLDDEETKESPTLVAAADAQKKAEGKKHGRDKDSPGQEGSSGGSPMPGSRHGRKGEEKRKDFVTHAPMNVSFSKIHRHLRAMPPVDAKPIMDRLHGYYTSAGSMLESDMPLLANQQSNFSQFRDARKHHAVLARPLL
mmetsp:Transcript_69583/g.153926  ORF Transcript_69583/g.153926 Transcript_69583/m.153926 type:complete len:961 (-) Transcript_69583:85-2967(-)